MTHKKTTNPWMRRHLRDPYVKQATQSGYRSRAAFKLIELDERDQLFRPAMTVIDLGAAPGGWSQVARERVGPAGRVIAVDVSPMQPLAGVQAIVGNILDPETQSMLRDVLGDAKADLVLSDMAPNLSGIGAVDEARSQALVVASLACAQRLLNPRGRFLVKVFHGSGLDAVIRDIRGAFVEVSMRKPPASRSRSSEAYVVCSGLK